MIAEVTFVDRARKRSCLYHIRNWLRFYQYFHNELTTLIRMSIIAAWQLIKLVDTILMNVISSNQYCTAQVPNNLNINRNMSNKYRVF
jgi:hypothetical protein